MWSAVKTYLLHAFFKPAPPNHPSVAFVHILSPFHNFSCYLKFGSHLFFLEFSPGDSIAPWFQLPVPLFPLAKAPCSVPSVSFSCLIFRFFFFIILLENSCWVSLYYFESVALYMYSFPLISSIILMNLTFSWSSRLKIKRPSFLFHIFYCALLLYIMVGFVVTQKDTLDFPLRSCFFLSSYCIVLPDSSAFFPFSGNHVQMRHS